MHKATCPWCGRVIDTDLLPGSDPMCDECRDELLGAAKEMTMENQSIRPREGRSGRFVNCGICGREVRLEEMREHMLGSHLADFEQYAARRKRTVTSYSPQACWQISLSIGHELREAGRIS
jgi:hypothetical protein